MTKYLLAVTSAGDEVCGIALPGDIKAFSEYEKKESSSSWVNYRLVNTPPEWYIIVLAFSQLKQQEISGTGFIDKKGKIYDNISD